MWRSAQFGSLEAWVMDADGTVGKATDLDGVGPFDLAWRSVASPGRVETVIKILSGRKMSRRVLGFLLVAAAVTSACTGGANSGRGSGTAAKTAHVPNLLKLTTSKADSMLQGKELLLSVRPVGGDDAVVVSQMPEAGERVPRGSVILVEARCYPAPCPFPGEGRSIYDPCTCAAR